MGVDYAGSKDGCWPQDAGGTISSSFFAEDRRPGRRDDNGPFVRRRGRQIDPAGNVWLGLRVCGDFRNAAALTAAWIDEIGQKRARK
jgi:hypothetical protein